MTLVRRLSLAMFLVAAVAATGWAAQDEVERIHRVVPLQPGGMLKLQTFSGHVVISATDGREVVIDAVRRAPRERLERVKLDIEISGSTVRIDANKRDSWFIFGNNVVETDFDIKVPRKTDIDVSAFSSPIRISGVLGTHHVHSFSGTLRMEEVTGPIKADTFSGDIEIQLAGAATEPELTLKTFSGNVDVRVPATARAQVDVSSFSGNLNSDVPLTLSNKSRHALRGEMGGQGGSTSVRVKTFSGAVHLRK
jgi:DUF4097 and DUF4098 domain-containing protein YvlB